MSFFTKVSPNFSLSTTMTTSRTRSSSSLIISSSSFCSPSNNINKYSNKKKNGCYSSSTLAPSRNYKSNFFSPQAKSNFITTKKVSPVLLFPRDASKIQSRSYVYGEKIIDHYSNPRNVGSLNKSDQDVGTGIVGAPACGDVMKLQIRVGRDGKIKETVFKVRSFIHSLIHSFKKKRKAKKREKKKNQKKTIFCGRFGCVVFLYPSNKTFGCGSAIASSSLATEMIKGKTLNECLEIKNSDIASYLNLPPVKLHCSMLAEDAIKAAIKDYQEKNPGATITVGTLSEQEKEQFYADPQALKKKLEAETDGSNAQAQPK